MVLMLFLSSRRRHTRYIGDWSSDVCSSDLYAEAVQTGNLLFLTGMLPTEGRRATFTGRIGAEIDVEGGRKAARLAALNEIGRASCREREQRQVEVTCE